MNFVLIHGAWHGGWCWRDVAKPLRDAGHTVFTPTMTGLGERAHLLNAEVGLSTFVQDACAVIENEELQDVVLVGHSFGGPVISGVADRMPERLRHLVYLDALIVQDGLSALDMLPPEVRQERSRTIDPDGLRMAIPAPDKFGISDPVHAAWLQRRLTPHPLKAYAEPLALRNPIGNGVPCTYIAATDPWYGPCASSRAWVKSQQGWGWREIAAGHDAMVSAPLVLAGMLREIAGA
ncbi:alpha/beta fold hydrolase [Lacisediminimonas profundi]|uniref:alpha/beta fold hydrolase n=1 Tax=Lacisediminimonas profundi TaxID=2603856 RepID=UPI00124BAF03|nr:alpha/beta hydrolase family protein [Lacisediminimonas profundi]